MKTLRLATRKSPLALAQAQLVADALAEHDIESVVVAVVTSGDIDQQSDVSGLTEIGAFVGAVHRAVLEGEADVAVHSGKDLPTDGPPGLAIAYPLRASPWDALVGRSLEDLGEAAVVGTGAPRRSSQLVLLVPGTSVVGIRGNVGTRIDAIRSGVVDAVVLAEAGLDRLGRSDEIDHRLTLEEMVPAPAQAALALETLAASEASELIALLDDPDTRRAVTTERMLLAATGAGCRAALGAHAAIAPDGTITFTTFVEDFAGARRTVVVGSDSQEVVDGARREMGL